MQAKISDADPIQFHSDFPMQASIVLEEANPDVFHDCPVRCAVSGVHPGNYFISITLSNGPVGSSPKPCGWYNMLLLKNGEAYDQIMFDQSAAIQVESDGAADFGLKFLSLSKDGLLPQYPMRVTLSRDKDARDVVVSTASLRVILYKMCVRQAAEDITSPFPKFELSVIDMFNNKIDIYGKVELHLYSTASPPHMPINRMEWLREPLSWSYERGPRGSDQSQLPALISIKTSAIMTGKSAFRLRATMLGINSTAFSLTKIGRGFSAPFNLTGDSRQLATKPQYMPSVYQSTGQNAGIVRLTALESLPPSGSADTAVPKTPQDIFRQFAQVVMRSLHNAYMSTSGDGFNADALNDAYEMYQKLDMNSCLAQLKNPTAVQLSKPQAFEKVTISLKSFPLPASGVIKAMTSTLSATEAAVTSKSLIATRLLPGTDNANAAEMTIPNNEGAYSSPKQSSLALFSRQQHADTIESQVMCVNKLYISIAGKFYGYPAHRQHDLALIGFYEEIADGGSVKFCPAEAIPHKVLEFLNVFCREHGNGHSFFKSDGNVNAMKAEIIVSLPHKQFYHFPQ